VTGAEPLEGGRRTITEQDIEQFAALTGDRHPAHTDQAWAEENLFGERVAHGLLVLSFAIGMVPTEAFVALRRIKNVVFKSPVRIGDTIHAEMKLVKVRPINDELALATGRVTVVKQDGAAALKMELEALMRRGPD
jgi:3-hydroxybutyryl-CoA dehydratase